MKKERETSWSWRSGVWNGVKKDEEISIVSEERQPKGWLSLFSLSVFASSLSLSLSVCLLSIDLRRRVRHISVPWILESFRLFRLLSLRAWTLLLNPTCTFLKNFLSTFFLYKRERAIKTLSVYFNTHTSEEVEEMKKTNIFSSFF